MAESVATLQENRTLRKLRIFVASPSDVTTERAKLETVIASLKPMADYLGLTLEVVDWRAVVPDAGRPQHIIFDQLQPTSWDIFVGILWHRFGTPPGAKDKTGKDYLSGTEEEFKTAYELWKQYGKPRIVIYRCTRTLPYDVDPDQLKRVREFFMLIENVKGDYPTLYKAFDTTESFEKLLLYNLQKLLIEYSEQAKTPITPEVAQVLVPTIPNNLPRRTAFFGRAKEMNVVIRALSPTDRTWGILVDGIGGIGKTALAIEAAHCLQDADTFDAFVFISAKQNILKPSGIQEQTPAARTLDDFLNETARVLGQPGITKLTDDAKRRPLLDVLRTMHALLIYDNLETLSKEEQEALADFLRELPQGCKAIITSRRRGGEGAVWLRVEKLDWVAARGIIENQMSLDAGLANKLRRVPKLRWQELYDETNGSPLALVHTLGLMRVRASMTFDGALAMLRGNRDADLQNFIFQEARRELTMNDKSALGALSFFVPSATFEAWMQVAKLSRNALETTIDRLSALSLVDLLAGEEHYALHPLTRAFVRDELLADSSIARETGIEFARYWMDFAKRYGGEVKKSYKTYDQLETEWNNIDAAANWLWGNAKGKSELVLDKNAAEMLSDLANTLCGPGGPLFFRGLWDESICLSKMAYEVKFTFGDFKEAGWHAYCVVWVYSPYARNLIKLAIIWLEKSIAAWTKEGSKREQSIGIRMRGLIKRQEGNFEKAEHDLQESLAIRRDLGQNRDVILVLIDLGVLERERKNYDAANRYFSGALELSRKLGEKETEAAILGFLGDLALDREQWAEAPKWLELGLPLAQKIGHQGMVAVDRHRLARVHEAEGRSDLALPLAQEALKIYERLQHRNLAAARELVERLTIALNKKQI